MAKNHTPTVREITKKLKQMGYHKMNGKANDALVSYQPKRKDITAQSLQVKEARSKYVSRKRKK